MAESIILPIKVSGAALATTICELITHPFDVIKTKKQITIETLKLSPAVSQHSFSTVYQHNGIGGLYKGFAPSFLKGVQNSTMKFGIFEMLNNYTKQAFELDSNTSASSLLVKTATAFVASFCSSLFGNPWDVLKIRMISDQDGNYNTLSRSVRNIYKKHGVRELLKGSSISVSKSILVSTIDLTVYDTCKNLFKRKDVEYDARAYFLASIASSLTIAVVAYPLDFIKTLYLKDKNSCLNKLQGNNNNSANQEVSLRTVVKMLKCEAKEKGIRGLYMGFTPFLVKSMIYGPLFWNSYEIFSHSLKKISQKF